MKVKNIVLLSLFFGSLSYYFVYTPLTSGYYGMPMMYNHYQSDLGFVDLIVLWIGLSSFTLLVLEGFSKIAKTNNKAIDIINMRLSKGEITIEEYKEFKQEIVKRWFKWCLYLF